MVKFARQQIPGTSRSSCRLHAFSLLQGPFLACQIFNSGHVLLKIPRGSSADKSLLLTI